MTTQYADYTYYTSTYKGSLIASADFDGLAMRASAQLDRLTFNRARTETDADNVDAIKMATCSVAEVLSHSDTNGGDDGIASERVGNLQITYSKGSVKSKTLTELIRDSARVYLEFTGLMFPGFYTDEYGTLIDDEAP